MITISSSWIFNRLCEEPQRLRSEMNQIADKMFNSESRHDVVAMMDFMYKRYYELQIITKQVAEMRLESNPIIEVVNDTPYMKVISK